MVGRCLANVGIYYAPLSSLKITRAEDLETPSLDQTWEEKLRAIAPYAGGLTALILLIAGARYYYKKGGEEFSEDSYSKSSYNDFQYDFEKFAKKGKH